MKKLFSLMLFVATISSVSAALLTQGISSFRDQPYWGGKAKFITENGKKVLELTSSVKGDRYFGRAFLPYGTKETFVAKDKIVATAKVRGKGKFFIGILKYRPKVGMPVTVFVEPVELSDSFKEVKFVFELEDNFEKIYPYLQVQGEGIAYIESFKLEKSTDPSLKNSPVVSEAANAASAKPPVAGVPAKDGKTYLTLVSGIASFRDQPYWGGKAKVITENGKKVLELTSSVNGDRHFGRAFLPYYTKEMFFPEMRMTAVVKVRGKGKFFVGLLKYLPGKGSPINTDTAAVELADTVKEFRFSSVLDNYYERVYPYLQVQGEGIAYVESFRLEKIIDNAVKISVDAPLQIIPQNVSAAPIVFASSAKNSPVSIIKLNGKNTVVEKINSNAAGNVNVAAAKYFPGTTHVCASTNGVGVKSFVSVVTTEEYNKTDSIARRIKLKKPIKMLMIGDSLSDFYRGYNYIDRINFWINKYNPGKFSFHNAGVGGDFLERTSNRMEVELNHIKKWVYRQNMYDGIFKDEYDYVFIWLGQNDTRCWLKDNYSTPETTVEEQKKYLTLILNGLKEKCPKAKVVIVSPSPSDEALFDSYIAKGRKVSAFYGRKKYVDAYDAYNRVFCKENKLDYIDVLSIMRNYKPLKDIYVTDGIHLSDKGGIIVADEFLKYFAEEFK